MIQQIHIETRKAYTLPVVGKEQRSLTVPGLAINLQYAMKQYKMGSPIEKMKAIYEEEGVIMPNFNMMSRIEKLEELAKFRQLKTESISQLNNIRNEAIREESIQKEAAAQRKSDTGKPQSDSKDGDNKQGK